MLGRVELDTLKTFFPGSGKYDLFGKYESLGNLAVFGTRVWHSSAE